MEVTEIPVCDVDLYFDPNPPGAHDDWQDEANIEEHYVNVYLPTPRNRGYGYNIADNDHPEVIEWLNENVGTRRARGIEWYQKLSEDVYDWSIRGVVSWKSTDCIQVMVKDKNKALMLKLTWGGL